MNREQVWKNFDLGQELSISGGFIYDGLRSFHEMSTLEHADEIFDCLYRLAVGLERLSKVAVVLLEHDGVEDQQKFEESLITHSHLDLLKRVKAHRAVKLGTVHNEFLALLGTFYKTFRYDRFVLAEEWEPDKEKAALREFLAKQMGDGAKQQHEILALLNNAAMKNHVEKLVGKISKELYDVVRARAAELNLYTYELRHGSKAARVYGEGELGFLPHDVLCKELLVYFMNTKDTSGVLGFLRGITPLEFDPGSSGDYIQALLSDEGRREVEGELSELYDGLAKEDRKERLRTMELVGNPHVFFDDDDEEGNPQDDELL